jgi:hypothetical protein
MDKMSCDNLLNSILVDKVNEDLKQKTIQFERLQKRNDLVHRHNERIAQAEKIGIKYKNSKIMPTDR